MKKGDIVEFGVPGLMIMGQIKELYQADVMLAKIRCVVDRVERFFYVPVDHLQPARFPEYYKPRI